MYPALVTHEQFLIISLLFCWVQSNCCTPLHRSNLGLLLYEYRNIIRQICLRILRHCSDKSNKYIRNVPYFRYRTRQIQSCSFAAIQDFGLHVCCQKQCDRYCQRHFEDSQQDERRGIGFCHGKRRAGYPTAKNVKEAATWQARCWPTVSTRSNSSHKMSRKPQRKLPTRPRPHLPRISRVPSKTLLLAWRSPARWSTGSGKGRRDQR